MNTISYTPPQPVLQKFAEFREKGIFCNKKCAFYRQGDYLDSPIEEKCMVGLSESSISSMGRYCIKPGVNCPASEMSPIKITKFRSPQGKFET